MCTLQFTLTRIKFIYLFNILQKKNLNLNRQKTNNNKVS